MGIFRLIDSRLSSAAGIELPALDPAVVRGGLDFQTFRAPLLRMGAQIELLDLVNL